MDMNYFGGYWNMWSDDYEKYWLASHGEPEQAKPQQTPPFTWEQWATSPSPPVDKNGDEASKTPFPVDVFLSAQKVWDRADVVSVVKPSIATANWEDYSLKFTF